jgi:hypothetical protein
LFGLDSFPFSLYTIHVGFFVAWIVHPYQQFWRKEAFLPASKISIVFNLFNERSYFVRDYEEVAK